MAKKQYLTCLDREQMEALVIGCVKHLGMPPPRLGDFGHYRALQIAVEELLKRFAALDAAAPPARAEE